AVVRMMSAEGSFGSEVTGVFAVEKTAEMIEKIKNLLKSGLSPTALNTLIRCPLNFYYKYILGVGELEDPDEEVSASEFGTLVHRALELLYADMDGKPVTFAFLAEAKKQVDSAIHTALNEQMAEPRPEGKLLLSLELAKFQVQRLLDLEKSRITRLGNSGTALIYMGSEQTLSYETVVDLEQESIPLVFKGKIDRIEKTGNTIWVIDYKTGAVEAADLSVRSWDQLKNATKSKALQLAVYGLALNRRYPGMELKSGIVSTISPQEEPLSLKIEGKEVVYTSAEEAIITEVLTDVIREVLTMELPFVHDPKSNYCAYCHG
ncbi:MAG: PD-(D/E)XK nuclease family protein, partial [Bacteroidota bacterium]